MRNYLFLYFLFCFYFSVVNYDAHAKLFYCFCGIKFPENPGTNFSPFMNYLRESNLIDKTEGLRKAHDKKEKVKKARSAIPQAMHASGHAIPVGESIQAHNNTAKIYFFMGNKTRNLELTFDMGKRTTTLCYLIIIIIASAGRERERKAYSRMHKITLLLLPLCARLQEREREIHRS